MTKEHTELLPRHAEFARRVAGGEPASAVYRDLYPKSRAWKQDVVWKRASELSGKVQGRVKEIQKMAKDVTVADLL